MRIQRLGFHPMRAAALQHSRGGERRKKEGNFSCTTFNSTPSLYSNTSLDLGSTSRFFTSLSCYPPGLGCEGGWHCEGIAKRGRVWDVLLLGLIKIGGGNDRLFAAVFCGVRSFIPLFGCPVAESWLASPFVEYTVPFFSVSLSATPAIDCSAILGRLCLVHRYCAHATISAAGLVLFTLTRVARASLLRFACLRTGTENVQRQHITCRWGHGDGWGVFSLGKEVLPVRQVVLPVCKVVLPVNKVLPVRK